MLLLYAYLHRLVWIVVCVHTSIRVPYVTLLFTLHTCSLCVPVQRCPLWRPVDSTNGGSDRDRGGPMGTPKWRLLKRRLLKRRLLKWRLLKRRLLKPVWLMVRYAMLLLCKMLNFLAFFSVLFCVFPLGHCQAKAINCTQYRGHSAKKKFDNYLQLLRAMGNLYSKRKPVKLIFLDVDGVLNSAATRCLAVWLQQGKCTASNILGV